MKPLIREGRRVWFCSNSHFLREYEKVRAAEFKQRPRCLEERSSSLMRSAAAVCSSFWPRGSDMKHLCHVTAAWDDIGACPCSVGSLRVWKCNNQTGSGIQWIVYSTDVGNLWNWFQKIPLNTPVQWLSQIGRIQFNFNDDYVQFSVIV